MELLYKTLSLRLEVTFFISSLPTGQALRLPFLSNFKFERKNLKGKKGKKKQVFLRSS
jgi:hypothetical protein